MKIDKEIRYLNWIDEKQDQLTMDSVALFLNEKSGHMGLWEYGASKFADDPAGGADHWARLVKSPGAYYPMQGDIDTIRWAMRQEELQRILAPVNTVVEYGPGSVEAITQKTFPFLKTCPALNLYVSVDAEIHQAEAAGSSVHSQLGTKIKTIEKDYTLSSIERSWGGTSAFIMWGISLGNISGHLGNNPVPQLVQSLIHFSKSLIPDDLFIVSFDTESDEDRILAAYSEPMMKESILSVLFRLRRDGYTTGDFDPWMWEHEPVWNAQVGQCAHMVYPKIDQSFKIKGHDFFIPAGTRFVTNNSYKFSPAAMKKSFQDAGFRESFVLKNGSMALIVGRL